MIEKNILHSSSSQKKKERLKNSLSPKKKSTDYSSENDSNFYESEESAQEYAEESSENESIIYVEDSSEEDKKSKKRLFELNSENDENAIDESADESSYFPYKVTRSNEILLKKIKGILKVILNSEFHFRIRTRSCIT